MKRYKDLDLIKIREACGLDFARHTYSKGQCSCCYGPLDMPIRKYWAKGKSPLDRHLTPKDMDNIPYILFKNAENGSGTVRLMDYVEDYTCIEYNALSDEQMDKVCRMLQEQLGDEYIVQKPKDIYHCIIIRVKEACQEKQEGKR